MLTDPGLGGLLPENSFRLKETAVVDETTSVTYEELERWTNQIAWVLASEGVVPGERVALVLPRSVWLLAGVLAVAKAGGTYVPMDPDYPAARLQAMFDCARPRVVISVEAFAEKILQSKEAVLLLLDADARRIEAEDERAFPSSASPEDPLYMIFTSGSTGAPKGAVVQRRGFANLLDWYGTEFCFQGDDRVLLLSSPSFDLMQKNLFAPLRAGGRLICYPSGPFDLSLLVDLIERHGITILNCTPSAFYPLVETADDVTLARLASLRLVVLGGEPIAISRLRRWLDHPSCRAEIANTYGPTECTDICAFHRMPHGAEVSYSFMPLGRTLPNVQLAVLDEEQQPCPSGQAGELVVGGIGVGLGYLGDPEQTRQRFIPNPSPEFLDGPVVYRTGDRVKIGSDGLLEFLGRQDYQVKIRGFRIELPEVEVALAAHPAVRESAVFALESPAGGELFAFYVSGEVTVDELRMHLLKCLPAHMVPARFASLPEFPLTPNGKVDRLSLSKLIPKDETAGEAPPACSDFENGLIELWSEVLGRKVTALDVNFFDAGGDSLRLARLHVLLATRLGVKLSITDLFAHPTVRGMAAHLSKNGPVKQQAVLNRAARQRHALASHARR